MTYTMFVYDRMTNLPLGRIIFEEDGGEMGEARYEDFDNDDLGFVLEVFSTIDHRKMFYDNDSDPSDYLWNVNMLGIELRNIGYRVMWSPPLPEDMTAPFSVEFPYQLEDDDEVPDEALEALPE